ncbi:putative cyclin-dependent kinase inhibitor domain-containing protein [Helianthus annuus]|nr:putative cyclin-dependent kinase inhibitor domain-containing protein [Helianthus annuus]
MEVARVGVTTRARATLVETMETVDNPVTVKRRKLLFVRIEESESCSSTGSLENLKVSDLEESVETGSAVYNSDGDESTPESEFKAESSEMESTTGKHSSIVKNPYPCAMLSKEKMPPEAELEAFFAAAQEGLNKRFKDKYNFDIVDDTPLKGRFEWIQVTPGK